MCHILDGGGDSKVPDAWSRELTGVQVGDMLHDFVKGVYVFTFHSQRGLVRVELNLNRKKLRKPKKK